MAVSPFAFSSKLEQITTTGMWTSHAGENHSVGGASTANNLWVLRSLLQQERPAETLEIGFCHGISALLISVTQRELRGREYRHTAIDPFQRTTWKDEGRSLLEDEGVSAQFRLLEEFSSVALPRLVQAGEKFGFIYVDGSHLFEDVFLDAYYSIQLLNSGGVILFDDSTDPHVTKVLRFLKKNWGNIMVPFDLSPHQLPRRPWIKRLANWLGYRQLVAFSKVGELPRRWDSPFRNF